MTGERTEGERLAALKRDLTSPIPNMPLFSARNLLDGGEGSVDGATLIGGQAATGTQVNPARQKSGKE